MNNGGDYYYATNNKFDVNSLTWRQVGELRKARGFHGASVVKADEVQQFCGYYDLDNIN